MNLRENSLVIDRLLNLWEFSRSFRENEPALKG
jgi:hypothetical protein